MLGSNIPTIGCSRRLTDHQETIHDSYDLSLNSAVNVSESVDLGDDIVVVKTKYKQVRLENQQLRTLLKQNNVMMQKNIDQLKEEKNLSLRLCQSLLPTIKKFTKSTQSDESSQMLYQFPKTAEELIELLEKVQKNSQADEFFKKIFQQDPVESENKFLFETVNNLQLRLGEMERKYETLQRINRDLAFDLKTKTEELTAFKKTVVQTFENDS